MNKSDLPATSRLITMKWVFNIKNDGRYRARLVAMGFKQVLGRDYFESHSPVLSEVTFRLALIRGLQLNHTIMSIDIEKAFLESSLAEDIYISPPPGLEYIVETMKISVVN